MSSRSRWVDRAARAVGLSALALALVSATAPPAAAAQHEWGASSVGWKIDGSSRNQNVWNIDQEIQLPKTGRSTYWALQWTFSGSDDGGYMGIQTDGLRPDGSKGQMALFSLWNADEARGFNGRCGSFGGEGVGLSCRMNWTIRANATYRLRVWRGTKDSTGQWWEGWVHSDYSNTDYHLGDIHVPAKGGTRINPTSVLNFIEYYGRPVACTKVPRTIGIFTQPAFNFRGSRYDYYTKYRTNSYDRGDCTRGYFVKINTPDKVGVQLVNGGPS